MGRFYFDFKFLGASNPILREIVPVVDLTKPSENIPSGTQKSQSKDENKSPIIESHPIGRRPTFKHISIEGTVLKPLSVWQTLNSL